MLPGVTTSITDRRSSGRAAPSSGNWFVGGFTERGRDDAPTLITSMAQKVELLGERTADTAILHDALDVFFREGGRNAYVQRILGPAAAKATVNATDGSGTAMTINAKSKGAWGNGIDVVIAASSGNFTLTVTYNGVTVETSPTLATVAEAVAWASTTSRYIDIVSGTGLDPTAGTKELASGADDLNNVTSNHSIAALAKFVLSMGPGQVSLPGMTTAALHEALLLHAQDNRRIALLDAANSADHSTIGAAALALRTKAGARFGGQFWPWAVVPGVAIGTTRTVPWSAVQAGMSARALAQGKNPGDPIAGRLGESQYAIGLSQDAISDAQREIYNDLGVNVAVMYRDAPRTFGNRTMANPITDSNWSQLSQSRTVAAVAAVAEEVGQDFFERKIDGRGFTLADYGQEIVGRACLPFYLANDLYGETPQEAFKVDTGPDVNTPATVAAGQLRAALSLRTSPGADMVQIEIVKVPTAEAL